MPETRSAGGQLLQRLQNRFPKAADASRALGKRPNTVAVWINRGSIPPKEWDRVRALLDGSAHPLRLVRPPKGVVIDPDRARRLREFVHLVLNTPGFKDLLLGHAWAPEDRKVVSEIIEGAEADADG